MRITYKKESEIIRAERDYAYMKLLDSQREVKKIKQQIKDLENQLCVWEIELIACKRKYKDITKKMPSL